MRKKMAITGIVGVLLCAVGIAGAQIGNSTPAHDKRVGRILDNLDINYKISDQGNYRVIVEMEEGRSQLAIIESNTNEYRNMEIREIWSAGYRSKGEEFPGSVANKLLEKNSEMKLGAWEKVGNTAYYSVKIAADSNEDTLYSALRIALLAGEEVEQALMGGEDPF